MPIGPIKITLADRYENPYPTDVHSPYTAPVSTPVQNTSGPGPWNNFNPVSAPSIFTDTADDRFKNYAAENLLRDTGNNTTANDTSNTYEPRQNNTATVANAVPTTPVLTPKVYTQRTPSGTIYAPDLSAYNDSSLFNYTGPGGLDEYTYGQGLRTGGADYSIFGTPADAINPYYKGQFKPRGPADAAINMPAVELPEGVQPVSVDVSMPAFNGITPRPPSSAGDLTYQQTIDEMGIFGPDNPPPSTMFPSPNNAEPSIFLSPEQQAILAEGMQPSTLPRQPTVQEQADQLQNMADQMALNLTPEELRDGLFIRPTFSKGSDGNFVGKMGIPDAFLQDKTPIESEADYSFNDSMLFNQPLTQAEMDNQDLYQGNDGNYYKNYDDLGTQPVTPEPVAGPREETINDIDNAIAKLKNKIKFENQYTDTLKTTREFAVARADAIIKAVNNERADVKDVARRPTPALRPTAPAGGYSTGSLNNSFSTRRDVRNLFA